MTRPAITPAQLISAVPILAALLAAFGLYDPTQEQQDALEAAIAWAAALVLGDAGLRGLRNLADAKVAASPSTPAGNLEQAVELNVKAPTPTNAAAERVRED